MSDNLLRNKKTNSFLDTLVARGDIKSYEYSIVSEEPGQQNRLTEEVVLVFHSGKRLTLGTFCSGSAGNTTLQIGMTF